MLAGHFFVIYQKFLMADKINAFLYIFPVLTFAAETCMYTNGLRIRIAVYVYCEDGYFCCENNTQCWLVFFTDFIDLS